ncbi:MAG TPA: hypothetical protein VGG73_00685, partial [Vicinamibacterales bacterium]
MIKAEARLLLGSSGLDKRQMRLSRLGTDSSLPPDYQGFRGRVRVGPIDPRGGSAEQLPAHQTDRG